LNIALFRFSIAKSSVKLSKNVITRINNMKSIQSNKENLVLGQKFENQAKNTERKEYPLNIQENNENKRNIIATNIKENNKNTNNNNENFFENVKNFFNTFFYYLPQDQGFKNSINSYTNISLFILSIILLLLFFKIMCIYLPKNDDLIKNSNINQTKIISPDNVSTKENKSNSISLKGRIKKIPNIINYNEMFINNNGIFEKKLEEKENMQANQTNLNIINKFFDNNSQFNAKSNDEESNKIKIEENKKRPLPRSRDDLLFFNELEENNQESNNNLIDYDLHFLKKEEKEEKEEKKGNC